MELYIHIPFCIRKCAYCDFLSGPADAQTQERYLTALKKEICLTGQQYAPKAKVETIFIGGGTPSAVDARWIQVLMNQVRESFQVDDDAEITMEANPGTLTAQKLSVYRQAGINRLSMGLQSTDDAELARLGRIHTYEEFLENYRLAREAGFTNINIDLMSALPGQTLASYEEGLRKVLALSPEHISAYSLIIEEGTPFWDRYGEEPQARKVPGEWILPDEEEDRRMYHRTKEILAEFGYDRYEISNYARPGYACRHNAGYWTGVPYLGLGLGASSYEGDRRYSNTREMEEYLAVLMDESCDPKQVKKLYRDVQILTVEEQMEEFMFLGLRLTDGVKADVFQNRFGRSLQQVYGQVLKDMETKGLLEQTGDQNGWRLTQMGLDVSNYVLAEFLL